MRTFGTVAFDGNRKKWMVQLEPHVMLRAKRVFGKVESYQRGTILLHDSPENARDLEWFVGRYPLDVKDESYLRERADAHRDRALLIDRLLHSQQVPMQFEMAKPPREYQRVAATMVLGTGALLLADDVGLGKTCSAICTFTDPRTLPALVVTLSHLPMQWEREVEKFMPQLTTHIIKKGTPYDITGRARLFGRFPDVLLINYHKLNGWAETLAPLVKTVIFDECQELRHAKHQNKPTAKYTAAQHIANAASFRLGLSATPIYNYGGEIFNVLDVISPGALGLFEEFRREWCWGYDDKPKIMDPAAFGNYVRDCGLMLRRTRIEVGRELPPITKVPHEIDADPSALDAVSDACAELAKIILASAEAKKGDKLQASEHLTNLMRQATGIAKAPFVAEFVKMLLDSEERVVLYGWHREVYSIWLERLKAFNPVLYTGSESPTQKEESRQKFLKGESRVLIISLRSGAGLDGLQEKCRTVLFGELDWSPAVHEQCIGRIARDGQKEPVLAYFLMSASGSDPVVADVLGLKTEQIEGVRDPKQDLVTKLQTDGGHARRLAEEYLRQHGIEYTGGSDGSKTATAAGA
jgi:superfamily II DNA or RNA helicase